MVGEACLPSNAYYPRTIDYSGVHVCWYEHSDSSFVYVFMSLDYGFNDCNYFNAKKLFSNDIWLFLFLIVRQYNSGFFLNLFHCLWSVPSGLYM